MAELLGYVIGEALCALIGYAGVATPNLCPDKYWEAQELSEWAVVDPADKKYWEDWSWTMEMSAARFCLTQPRDVYAGDFYCHNSCYCVFVSCEQYTGLEGDVYAEQSCNGRTGTTSIGFFYRTLDSL